MSRARVLSPAGALAAVSAVVVLVMVLMTAGNPLRGAGASTGALSVSPRVAVPGSAIRISATGLPANTPGNLAINGAPYQQVQTNNAGGFTVLLQMPVGMVTGNYSISFDTDRALAKATLSIAGQATIARTPNAASTTASAQDGLQTTAPPPGAVAVATSGPAAAPPRAAVISGPTGLPTSTVTPDGGLALGVFLAGSPEDPGRIDRYTTLVGKSPAIVMWYHDWAHGGFNKGIMDGIAARGSTPMVTWEPWDYTRGIVQPAFALRTIASGTYDAYIRQYARDSAAWGQPFYLRFAHEMNGDWYPWGRGISGNTPDDFVAAWRRVHDIFREEGATNVRWVWSPNVEDANSTPYNLLYPGDAYVDWVGIVGYNWGASYSWSGWVTFAALFGPSYAKLVTLTQKPLMITEVGSSETGGDKAAWILQGLLNDLPIRFPRVRAVLWFNANQEADWAITTSPAALEAFRRVVQSPLYQNRVP